MTLSTVINAAGKMIKLRTEKWSLINFTGARDKNGISRVVYTKVLNNVCKAEKV